MTKPSKEMELKALKAPPPELHVPSSIPVAGEVFPARKYHAARALGHCAEDCIKHLRGDLDSVEIGYFNHKPVQTMKRGE